MGAAKGLTLAVNVGMVGFATAAAELYGPDAPRCLPWPLGGPRLGKLIRALTDEVDRGIRDTDDDVTVAHHRVPLVA